MSSSMPLYDNMCCICFEPIRPGERALDPVDKQPWDFHSGRCASEAGLDE